MRTHRNIVRMRTVFIRPMLPFLEVTHSMMIKILKPKSIL